MICFKICSLTAPLEEANVFLLILSVTTQSLWPHKGRKINQPANRQLHFLTLTLSRSHFTTPHWSCIHITAYVTQYHPIHLPISHSTLATRSLKSCALGQNSSLKHSYDFNNFPVSITAQSWRCWFSFPPLHTQQQIASIRARVHHLIK